MSVPTDFTFPREYECQILEELPGSDGPAHQYFRAGSTFGGQDGVLVQVTPKVSPWLGTFAFGKYGNSAVSRLVSMPDPTRLCVVAKGEGYIVSAASPKVWESVCLSPVIDIRSLRDAGLVIFADFTQLAAYGREGLRWRTKRLTWSNMKLIEVTSEKIIGQYEDLGADEPRTFEVDVATGSHTGGVERD
jgi:hypothetical protein